MDTTRQRSKPTVRGSGTSDANTVSKTHKDALRVPREQLLKGVLLL